MVSFSVGWVQHAYGRELAGSRDIQHRDHMVKLSVQGPGETLEYVSSEHRKGLPSEPSILVFSKKHAQ